MEGSNPEQLGGVLTNAYIINPVKNQNLGYDPVTGTWRNTNYGQFNGVVADPPLSGQGTTSSPLVFSGVTTNPPLSGSGLDTNPLVFSGVTTTPPLTGLGLNSSPLSWTGVTTNPPLTGLGLTASPLIFTGIATDSTLSGNGLSTSPLSWSGAITNSTLSGNGTAAKPLEWNGAVTDGATISGNGLTGSPLTWSLLTTPGDIAYYDTAPSRLPIGNDYMVFTVVNGLPAWVYPGVSLQKSSYNKQDNAEIGAFSSPTVINYNNTWYGNPNFDNSTGLFTVPGDGWYNISASIAFYAESTEAAQLVALNLITNSKTLPNPLYSGNSVPAVYSGSTNTYFLTTTFGGYMSTGETIGLQVYNSTASILILQNATFNVAQTY